MLNVTFQHFDVYVLWAATAHVVAAVFASVVPSGFSIVNVTFLMEGEPLSCVAIEASSEPPLPPRNAGLNDTFSCSHLG